MNALRREDAFYYMYLLLLGFSDGYDEWLESYLKTDEPMSDLVIDLYFCGSNLIVVQNTAIINFILCIMNLHVVCSPRQIQVCRDDYITNQQLKQ